MENLIEAIEFLAVVAAVCFAQYALARLVAGR
jgi:hypothetical protein